MDKKEILEEFSADSDKYYKVKLFEEEGFVRKSCTKCSRFFWTRDPQRVLCPDDGRDTYSFIGDPPTTRRFDYTKAWQQIESFFKSNGHTSVPRYPVVCRWRDDLFFTIASIVDFQRVMGSKVIFEFPANPLVVPQTCLRFKDLENVGVTGRHFSSFCMIGQHSVPDHNGYWKDECINLDYNLLTEQFGISGDEVVFVEDVWAGGGSFGPSLEYFVRGLELGNAVFTEFQGELGKHTTLDQRIIDMGAGLERLAWITMGTPTAYDCCFGPINDILADQVGIERDADILRRYFTEIAKGLEKFNDLNKTRDHAVIAAGLVDTQVRDIIKPIETTYLIADHLRTLIFAISDGALPSNVGGGYNLRVMLRRIDAAAAHLKIKLDIPALIDAHVDYLKDTYPELDHRREDVKTILDIELRRYKESKIHMQRKAAKIQNSQPNVDDLLRLYESDGITPEYLKEINAIQYIPSEFYTKLAELHQTTKPREIDQIPLDGIPDTELLFYGDDPFEFTAQVLDVIGDQIVLDKTSFYARGGGQEPDMGVIAGFKVLDVQKHGGIILHKLQNGTPNKGDTVQCTLDVTRRTKITRNHTSTHIINASARKVLGSWIWQHSAFKDDTHARLDITHHSSLTDTQIRDIELVANDIIKQSIPISIQYKSRGVAEQEYGFRIYQGGVVPVKQVRIVSIGDKDVEACGGTHVSNTRDIKLIKITKTKRIQDGVVRIEFVSGDIAQDIENSSAARAKIQDERERNRIKIEQQRTSSRVNARAMIPEMLSRVVSGDSYDIKGVKIHNKRCVIYDEKYDERFCLDFGKKLVKKDDTAVFCGIFDIGTTVRVVVYAGDRSGMDSSLVADKLSKILGGASGGDAKFAQGGGRDKSKIETILDYAIDLIMEK